MPMRRAAAEIDPVESLAWRRSALAGPIAIADPARIRTRGASADARGVLFILITLWNGSASVSTAAADTRLGAAAARKNSSSIRRMGFFKPSAQLGRCE